jgi:hypothetical protein
VSQTVAHCFKSENIVPFVQYPPYLKMLQIKVADMNQEGE